MKLDDTDLENRLHDERSALICVIFIVISVISYNHSRRQSWKPIFKKN